MPTTTKDRWTILPMLMSLAVITVTALIVKVPGILGVLLFFLLIPGLPIAGIVLAAIALTLAVKKRPRRGASFLLALVMPVLLWSQIIRIADCIHLGMTAWLGAGQLGSTMTLDSRGMEAHDWSVGLITSPNIYLIHDKTDEIALPAIHGTHNSNADNDLAQECAGRVRHLLGHYYICTI